MLNNGKKTNCGLADEIVSYIYDEITTPERTKFENHLAQCSSCTDEFAAVSTARFAVFEWRKQEFAHLPTPEIAIPFAPRCVDETARAGIVAGVRAFVSRLSVPGLSLAAAGLLIVLSVGFAIMRYQSSGGQTVVSSVQPVAAPSTDTPPSPAVLPPSEIKQTTAALVAAPIRTTRNEIQTVKAVVHKAPVQRHFTAINVIHRNTTPKITKTPVLSTFEDSDDNSLRLSDLLDNEVGAR